MVEKRSVGWGIFFSLITCGLYSPFWMASINNDTNKLSRSNESMSGGQVVLLSIITCGLYGIYWSYVNGKRLNEAKQRIANYSSSSEPILYLILWIFSCGFISLALMQNDINNLCDLNER